MKFKIKAEDNDSIKIDDNGTLFRGVVNQDYVYNMAKDLQKFIDDGTKTLRLIREIDSKFKDEADSWYSDVADTRLCAIRLLQALRKHYMDII